MTYPQWKKLVFDSINGNTPLQIMSLHPKNSPTNAISRVIDLLECPQGAKIPDSLDILKDAQLTTEDMYMQGTD